MRGKKTKTRRVLVGPLVDGVLGEDILISPYLFNSSSIAEEKGGLVEFMGSHV